MKKIKDYLSSVKFSFVYSFRFAKRETFTVLFLMVSAGSIVYGSSYMLGRLVDNIISGTNIENYNLIWQSLLLYALASSLPQILDNLVSYFLRRRWLKTTAHIEIDILRVREGIDIATYEDPKFQDLSQRAFRSGFGPINQIMQGSFIIIRYTATLIVGTILAIHFNPLIYIIVICSAIPSFITDIKYSGMNWMLWSKDSPEQRRANDLRQHIFNKTNLVETKLLQSSNKLLKWIGEILFNFNDNQIKLEKSRLWQTSLTDTIAFIGFGFALFLVVKSVIEGTSQVGELVFMMGTLSSVRNSIGSILSNISAQFENSLIIQDMIAVINTKPFIVEAKTPAKLSLVSPPEIIFENVGFKYNSSDKWSLKNVNLTFKAGDNIGLVGNNGAGKTTLVKLLCRIYDPTEGRILINGVDMKNVSTKEWWSYLAVMFQDYATYDFQVKDAIAISRPDRATNLTRVIDASKVAQSHEFVMEWKNKYDEQLGVEFNGKEPSKGQKQKLSIAKILYRDGFVMILDEPTASVDAESEAKIFDSIENLPKDRTAILISHDFSTISQCDKIFVMDKGTLIEEGNHKELMAKKGMYSELYNLQAKRFKK